MSEFPLPPPATKKIRHFPSLLLSDFFLFCSFIRSHPLYFSYFMFFSPYLLKLLSFLSPLFITTFLLLLVLLTISPNLVHDKLATELLESKASFVLGIYKALVEKLRAKVEHGGEEFHQYVELEAYKIVFEASSPDLGNNPVEVLEIEPKEQPLTSTEEHEEVSNCSNQGNSGSDGNLVKGLASVEVKTLAVLLHEKDELEGLWCEKEEKEKEVKPLSGDSNKVEGERRRQAAMRCGSKGIGHRKSETQESEHYHYGASEDYYSPKSNASQRADEADLWNSPENGWDYYNSRGEYSPGLGSFGSMRREKEWRRTLACKLFEERHNVDGGEGMDLLWEAYEVDSVKSQGNIISKAKRKGKSKFGSKRSEFSYDHCCDEEEDEDEEEEEGNDGKLCCLQALKFSAGKMNLGMGRPNLVKISKALKGIGWLHKVGNTSKKPQRSN